MYKTVLIVNGMTCEMCEHKINDVVRGAFDVRMVKSSRKKKEAVILTEDPVDEEKLRRVINTAGYSAGAISCEPYAGNQKSLLGLYNKQIYRALNRK